MKIKPLFRGLVLGLIIILATPLSAFSECRVNVIYEIPRWNELPIEASIPFVVQDNQKINLGISEVVRVDNTGSSKVAVNFGGDWWNAWIFAQTISINSGNNWRFHRNKVNWLECTDAVFVN